MKRVLTVLIFLAVGLSASAHPTGTMVVIDGTVLWSYVCPVGDPDHHACVMQWDEEGGVRPWLVSSFPASDWMMAPAPDGNVYLVERYFDQARQTNKIRLLMASVGAEPEELMPWFDDPHRFGEGGFAALEDGRFLFARYPNLYVLNEDGSTAIWKEWPVPVFGLRQTHDGAFLIRGESEAWLTTSDGTIVESWSGLLQELNTEPPFMGNRVFDADYAEGALWLAYWGKRRFDFIKGNTRTVVKSFSEPWLPHAVAVDGSSAFMLASVIAPGSDQDIRPNLWRMKEGSLDLLWGEVDTEVEIKLGEPEAYTMTGAYPNPFMRQVQFSLRVARQQEVRVVVYDLQGRLVAVLFTGQIGPAEDRAIAWNARDAPNGLYVVQLEGETFEAVRHVLRVK